MPRTLDIQMNSFPIAGTFTISRGAKTEAEVITCMLIENGARGLGECVPYRRYGETMESVFAQIEATRPLVEAGISRHDLLSAMPPGAARNAVDCALWDLEAKRTGESVAARLGFAKLRPLTTAYTISLGEPEVMAAQAREHAGRALLKVKVGTGDDESRIRAVRAAAPDAAIILDANEGWPEAVLERHLHIAAQAGVTLVEQPLPAGRDGMLAEIRRPLLVCADESVHHTGDLASLADRYDAINIKLDKTGGLTEALVMKAEAERLGFSIMIGCMVGTSLAMAPAVLLAQNADFVDLDGPLLLARDRELGLRYAASLVFPPESALWG
ncbi:L-alanine-DL-glutamate epimerase-like enolase superfamily enzyme [Rhizobium leguminosarum]|uniref:Dipeptide epimerase n=1 Tax=Rhizobium leguminosarum TaxID=384 RepID=A0AAE2SW08_RHILE|nr:MULTISPECIES: N-acetyl-D-Glu racemase DgcA [Rhizobium]MBB4290112.1 L-alanine-DL-glutamate epimerase-like enolase superfamily enzyme [Rhizobium leguminosarum]MBB4296755.1 L-alanine-DL-glutamate epimerase-like enolase superfamily enzyme [Rhizobium leguminosarum]MBB4307984.1 L-alanine-DL-glutamate epimerase-like enolase superfamily enzyme [Rhizobium leguminosarum]MBB4415819.1 L-alanine-DL-glutamate epimerase-like enolase superfamily enzyme [Rhizobium leguminosarum]MBB4431214.1 L-alanine-DL-glu